MNYVRNKLIENSINLLENSFDRFSNYQGLPEFIFDKIPELRNLKYKRNQINLDFSRYKWLKENLNYEVSSVLDIGANLGYFSFSLANDLNVKVDLYEPYKTYYEVSKNLCSLIKFNKKMNLFNDSIGLNNISEIQKYDLVINLNILHHAGVFFDKKRFKEFDNWLEYSKIYLGKLREKSKFLFFQVGNLSRGEVIFESDVFFDLMKQLFKLSNWNIRKIGIIKNLEKLEYVNIDLRELEKVRLFKCRRNEKTNLVDYFFNGRIIKSLQTGFAQRPIILCD